MSAVIPVAGTVTNLEKAEPLLAVRDLTIDFGDKSIVKNLSFAIEPGETLAIVGESGSGKSVTALSLLGLLGPRAKVAGAIEFRGQNLLPYDFKRLAHLRGNAVSIIFQEPMAALNPVYKIGRQLSDVLRNHMNLTAVEARIRVLELLNKVKLPTPEAKYDQYPFELSGGQLQRVMIAMAIACRPKLLIADEPTTALDVTVQAGILDLLRELQAEMGMSVLFITHDFGVVADIADRVLVMRHGQQVETGAVDTLFAAPREDYTRMLLSAVPSLAKAGYRGTATPDVRSPVLQLRNVGVSFRGRRGHVLKALDGIDLAIARNEVVALVGESGSGKSTLGNVAAGLIRIDQGEVIVDGTPRQGAGASSGLHSPSLHSPGVSMVFQDANASLNPRMRIGATLRAALKWGRRYRPDLDASDSYIRSIMAEVGLGPELFERFPHELSGGQKQRVGIARALSVKPSLIVADEPTSALDVSVQKTVLELFRKLQQQHGFACIFITHDLSLAATISNRVVVMNKGRIVEQGPTADVLRHPSDPYTRALLNSIPLPDPVAQRARRAQREDAGANP
ncbi:dipeptide ABC transporter ATP-binding protein [Chelatococcus asaccharovorans]|uniref:dipeptide ABC transporter ATP-binding protein n=1 Tax=Chelatococcus asaccharovorans TaxID=28210 RepID=UPI00224C6868|nr:ABC transporter ATP-binding protein [Chelatococcus asaccharovorans]CAH1671023.1 Glutathione import ATP-binding protein GsiA [Chelatococcus asaccharovorans]CAH1677554.1 Glutathione import ATP-binding protein GsiA [Chelatococcus asaccharovorans]